MYTIELQDEKDFNEWLEFRKNTDSLKELKGKVKQTEESLVDLRQAEKKLAKQVFDLRKAKKSLTEDDVLVLEEGGFYGNNSNLYTVGVGSINEDLRIKLTKILLYKGVLKEPKNGGTHLYDRMV